MTVLKPLLTAAALLGASSMMSAQQGITIGVVDLRAVIEGSKQMEEARTSLEKEFSPKTKALQAKAEQLKKDAGALAKEKPVLTAKVVKEKEESLTKRQKEIALEEQSLQQAVYQKQQIKMEELLNKVKSASSAVAKKHGINMVLQKSEVVVMDDAQKDITEDVRKQLGS